MTVHWFRPPAADADTPVRSPLHGLMHGGDTSDCVLLNFPGASGTDVEITPTAPHVARVTETDLLFWSVHIPAGVLALGLLAATALGCFALAIITMTGGTY